MCKSQYVVFPFFSVVVCACLCLASWPAVVFHGLASSGPWPSTPPPVIIERSATRPPNPLKQDAPTVDQNAYLIDRDAFYQRLPAQYVQNRRIEDQAKLLEAYKKDPEGFLKGYEGVQRIFLFDAVIDAKNMVRVGTFGDGGKWVSDPQSLRTGTVVYSFGAGDRDLIRRRDGRTLRLRGPLLRPDAVGSA